MGRRASKSNRGSWVIWWPFCGINNRIPNESFIILKLFFKNKIECIKLSLTTLRFQFFISFSLPPYSRFDVHPTSLYTCIALNAKELLQCVIKIKIKIRRQPPMVDQSPPLRNRPLHQHSPIHLHRHCPLHHRYLLHVHLSLPLHHHSLLHVHSYHPLHYYHCSRPLHVHHPPSSTSRAPPLSCASRPLCSKCSIICSTLSLKQKNKRLTATVITKKPGTIEAKRTKTKILFILKRSWHFFFFWQSQKNDWSDPTLHWFQKTLVTTQLNQCYQWKNSVSEKEKALSISHIGCGRVKMWISLFKDV